VDDTGLTHDFIGFGKRTCFDDLIPAENLLMALAPKDDWIDPTATKKLRGLLVGLGHQPVAGAQSLILTERALMPLMPAPRKRGVQAFGYPR